MHAALDGRRAIVTGGGSGIGQATAVALAERGAQVAICGRSADRLARARAGAEQAGLDLFAHPCDLAGPDDIVALVETVTQRFGGIDILVNNAALIEMNTIEQVTVDDFDRAFAVNVRGPMLLAQAALDQLRASPAAAIVNVSSVAVHMGGPTMGMYRSSKAALLALTTVMAKEWGADGIRVNSVMPGKVDTDDAAIDADTIELAKLATPLGRLAEPRELADAICYLVGDDASYITGATLTVDGGVSF